ncbi:ANK3 [Symbiodinium sp. CCMP2592]|nr:ANK3 [Symbiodinium sp. CCMP2592]
MALCVLLEIQRGDRPSDVCAGLLDGLADWLKAPPILVRGLQPVEIGESAFKRDLGLALGTAPVFLQLRDARRDDAEAAGRLAVDHDLPPEDFCSCRAPLLSMAANRPRGDFEALLALRADVNKPDSRGHTPLVYAVFAYSRGCTTLLLRAGASVAPDTGYCPLLLSVAMGQCQMVNVLLHARACPHRRAVAGSLRGISPYGLACEWNDGEIMRAFRMHGHHTAGPHPPILPVCFSLSGCEVALSEAGAEHALILEQFHRMPSVGLLVAEEHSDRIAITYDSSASLPTYALALRRAFCRQDYDLAANILERRPFLIEEAEYIVWGDDGLPLVWAAKIREVGAISTLLQARASPNMTTPGHAAPLLLAARHGGIGSVALLLLARADVNHVDADGLSALSIGAALRSPPLVSLLLEFRAHLSTRPEVLLPLLNSTFQRDGLGHDHCEASVLLLRAAGGVGHSDVVHKVISELVPRLLAEGNWSAIFVVHCWAHLQLGLQSTVASGCCPASASGS